MKSRLKVYIAFALVIAAMAFLLIGGFDSNTMVYYSTVKELKAKGSESYGQGFRVSGKVVPGTVVKAGDRIRATFDMIEEGETLHVVYDGVLPDTFKEDMDVLVEGKYQRDGVFQATNVMTKCASKYEPKEGEAGSTAYKSGETTN